MNPTKIVRSTGVPLGWMRLDVGASKLLSAFAVQASVHTNPNRTRTVPYARYFRLKDIGSLITYSSKPSAVNKARQESPASGESGGRLIGRICQIIGLEVWE